MAPTLRAEDTRLSRIAEVESLVRNDLPAGRGGVAHATFATSGNGQVLVVWHETEGPARERRGTALFDSAATRFLDDTLDPIVRNHSFETTLRDRRRGGIWGEAGNGVPFQSLSLASADHWELAFTGAPVATGTRVVNYGLVLLPILMLGTGLLMTAWIVRRDLTLAQLQSTFVGAVTHEFKSPITSIRLLLERLSGHRAVPADAARRYLAAIGTETDRLEGLVNRLLESQKLQSGQKQYVFRPTSLEALTTSVVDRLRPHAEARGIQIGLTVEAGLPDVAVDRESLADAVGNLVDNAIKYSAAGTTIQVGVRTDEGDIRFEVIDEGIGVEPADADRIFEPFFRSQRGDQANVHCTGLGLSLVKAAAEAHGGSVTVSSDGIRP